MGSVRHAASLQAGVQGCNGGVGQRAQVPGRRVAGWQAVGHTTWAALRASPAGPSTAQTARPWRGRASARPDKQPSRFTTEACMSIYLVNTSHSTTQRNQSRLELRLSALSITRPADAHPCSRRPRWRLLQGHEPIVHWFSSNLWLIYNSLWLSLRVRLRQSTTAGFSSDLVIGILIIIVSNGHTH